VDRDHVGKAGENVIARHLASRDLNLLRKRKSIDGEGRKVSEKGGGVLPEEIDRQIEAWSRLKREAIRDDAEMAYLRNFTRWMPAEQGRLWIGSGKGNVSSANLLKQDTQRK